MAATVGSELARGIARLRSSPDATRSDAMLLLARATRRSREWIFAHDDAAIEPAAAAAFERLCEARATGMPLAYVLGEAGFYGRTFAVDSCVLVPRPETERLVADALDRLSGAREARVLDVGTGSGAIACTMAAELPDASVFGTDASAEAIEVARGNARSLRVADRCRFECGDLAAPAQTMRFDAVLANLPYVPSADVPQKPDPVGFEPRAALDGGADGLALYRRFVPGLPALLLPGGVALMEAAPHQMAALTALVRRRFPAARVRAERDFGGAERYVRVEAPGA